MPDVVVVDALTGQSTHRDYTAQEIAERAALATAIEAAQVAVEVTEGNRATIRDRATAALDINRAFLAIATPSNAQLASQLKEVTRQNAGIIRLVLGQLDGTE